MTSFTHADTDGDSLTVEPDDERGAFVTIDNVDGNEGVYVTADEAPAVALAILKAAGVKPRAVGSRVEVTAYGLAKIVAELDEALKDVALEAEALDLLRAATGEHFVELLGMAREFWLNAAKKARELHAPAPKEAEARFTARTAPKKPGTYWIVYDAEKDRVYPFGFGGERGARKAAVELAEGKQNFYFSEPNFNRYL